MLDKWTNWMGKINNTCLLKKVFYSCVEFLLLGFFLVYLRIMIISRLFILMFCYGVLCYFALYFEWITIVNIATRAFYPRGRRGKKSNPNYWPIVYWFANTTKTKIWTWRIQFYWHLIYLTKLQKKKTLKHIQLHI